MAKDILSEEEKELFDGIKGFTKSLEYVMENRKRSKENITLENVISMPTYEFVTLALSANSPRQVITAIEAIRKRYLLKFNIDKEAMGYLDSIEGKAYGYMSLYVKDILKQQKLYKLACKYFKSAISKGYYDANVDLADLEEKFDLSDKADDLLSYLKKDVPDAYRKLGELYCNFPTLVENATRVLQGRRPFIEDGTKLPIAMYHFNQGEKKSVECRVYKGLAMIIKGDNNEKEEGLKLVKDNLKEFKEKNKDIDKKLFATDAKVFKDCLSILENKLVKLSIR